MLILEILDETVSYSVLILSLGITTNEVLSPAKLNVLLGDKKIKLNLEVLLKEAIGKCLLS